MFLVHNLSYEFTLKIESKTMTNKQNKIWSVIIVFQYEHGEESFDE